MKLHGSEKYMNFKLRTTPKRSSGNFQFEESGMNIAIFN